MIYLYETLRLHTAMPIVLEEFINFTREEVIPLYESCGGGFMAAWISNSFTLFEIIQIIEFEDSNSYFKFLQSSKDYKDYEKYEKKLNSLAPERERVLFESPGSAFSKSFHDSIDESRENPVKSYSIARLDVVYEEMGGLIQQNEGAITAGLPLVTSMKSITGKQNQVINIWKIDLQAAGYQTQEYYTSIGFTEEWWNWIRKIAPQEQLLTVAMLPYSPLQ